MTGAAARRGCAPGRRRHALEVGPVGTIARPLQPLVFGSRALSLSYRPCRRPVVPAPRGKDLSVRTGSTFSAIQRTFMKSRVKSLLVLSLTSRVLAACGGGGSSGAQEEPLGEQPGDVQQPSIQQPTSEVPVVPEQPVVPQEPQEPVITPLPVAGQTGWTISGLETRDPLDLLKAIVCVERARMEMVPTPASSAECTTTFPDLVPNGSLRFANLPVPEGTVMEEREGCVFLSNLPMEEMPQALVCSWQFSKSDLNASSGAFNYWLNAPFEPSFTPGVESCEADTAHWFPMTFGRGDAVANGPTVKAPAYPQGCVGWQELTYFLEQYSEISLYSDRQPD